MLPTPDLLVPQLLQLQHGSSKAKSRAYGLLAPSLQGSSPVDDLTALACLDGLDEVPKATAAEQHGPIVGGPGAAAAASKAQLNAYGEPYQDWAAAAARKEELCALVGVWPAMAMINHACSPNASTLNLAGKVLVVRASKSIDRGEEVTITWVHAPLGLQKSFRCTDSVAQHPA
jgi:hypothetical protein